MQQSPSLLNTSINATTSLPSNQQQQLLSRPASAYFNSNTSSLTNPNPSATSSNLMTPNLNQSMSYNNMMAPASSIPSQLQQQQSSAQLTTHISHPNLSNMPSSSTNPNSSLVQMPLTANRPPILPNKNNFMRESQSQHSLRMTHQQQPPQSQQSQQQMMAPSMPNIAHASGYATNISASQSMQNVNQNYPLYNPQQSQLSPSQHQQNSLIRGQAKMAEMNEMLKRRNNQQPQQMNGMVHTNSMDNISMNPPHQFAAGSAQQQLQQSKPFGSGNLPQSPQKQLPPTTAPKPQVRSY